MNVQLQRERPGPAVKNGMVDSIPGEDLVAFNYGPLQNAQLFDRRHQTRLESGLVVGRANRYDEPTAD